jgi:branched-chain amino acid transport system ATP-binding protein
MSQPALLRLEGISSHYAAIRALSDVSLEVFPGEIVSLIGANGAGKSTTLMCISGIKDISAGSITFLGLSTLGVAPDQLVKQGLAQVPEGRKIFPRLTVKENLELGAYTRDKGTQLTGDFERIFSLFPILAERSTQLGGTLSGGEQQMLAIGRALMSHPKLLLLDEPSMGIAPILVKKIFETIATLNKEGMTILLVEQNAHAALELSHRGYVLETGTTTITNNSNALLSDPRVRAAYLGH